MIANTAPVPSGEMTARAMELSIKNWGLSPNQVNYINAHSTGTPAKDVNETLAIKKALGTRAFQIAISSTKSMTGHLFCGSGGIEAIATVIALFV
jgi:3-oxoacyl-[acyl-carrier-protein] synthase II